MDNAVSGLQAGIALINRGAQRIAASGQTAQSLDPADLAEGAVDLLAGRQQFEASAQVLKVEKQTLGTLLKRMA